MSDDDSMAAEITVKFKVSNIIGRSQLAEIDQTFEQIVEQLIIDEGIMGLFDPDEWSAVVEIKEWQS